MRTTHAASLLSLLLVAAPALAEDGWFKNPDLDYWNEGPKPKPKAAEPAKPKPLAEPAPLRPVPEAETVFRWEDYEDPTTDAFWDDGGSYRPPRPLKMAAANPTPENVAKYLAWQKRKIERITALQAEVSRQAGDVPDGVELDPSGAVVPSHGETTVDASQAAELLARHPEPIDWRRVEVVFFYSSDCPHCRASVETARALELQGTKVIPVQMDWKKHAPLLPSSVPYTAEIAKEQRIEAVPTWIVAYQGDRITMEGEVTVQSIEMSLKYAKEQQEEQQSPKRASLQ